MKNNSVNEIELLIMKEMKEATRLLNLVRFLIGKS